MSKKSQSNQVEKISLPTLLSFEKTITNGIGDFFAFKNENLDLFFENKKEFYKTLVPVTASVVTANGTRNDYKAQKESETNVGYGNPQRIEVALMPSGNDAIYISFDLIINPHWQKPHSCDNIKYVEAIEKVTQLYSKKIGMKELAKLYTRQILSGDWGWRNKNLCDDCYKVVVSNNKRKLGRPLKEEIYSDEKLYEIILNALENPMKSAHLKVEGFFVVGNSEIYPSQLFTEKSTDKTAVGKLLAKHDDNQVYFSSFKIGNALRTIDCWYNNDEVNSPIAISPYGVERETAYPHRKENGNHLYTYLEDLDTIIDELENGFKKYKETDLHFLMACLILGGVFNKSSK